jgi:hypothetical protein
MSVAMSPLTRLCTWLCGVLSRGPVMPLRRSHVAAVLFWPVGRLLANTSKLFSARIDAITAVPATFGGIVTVCELRVELKSGLGCPMQVSVANVTGSLRVRRPVPIRQGEIRVAGELTAEALEGDQVGTVPGEEKPIVVRAEVIMDLRLPSPIPRVGRRQRLHCPDRRAVGHQNRIIGRHAADTAP